MSNDFISDAILSDCGLYRYWLTRQWSSEQAGVVFIGYNPSLAKLNKRDSTDKKCEGFARRAMKGWYGLLNPFAYIATKPSEFKKVYLEKGEEYATGPENNEYIVNVLRCAKKVGDPVVAAWGTLGGQQFAKDRILNVVQQAKHEGVRLHCLGLTKHGHPRHPLMVGYKQPIEPLPADWTPPA